MMQRIDLAPLLRETVATPYSDMVTRSTGAALRDRIEQTIAGASHRTTQLDFTAVGLLDFSCADEVVAKLLLRVATEDEHYVVLSGITDSHLDAIDHVLERHGLSVAALTEGEAAPGCWASPPPTRSPPSRPFSGWARRCEAAGRRADLDRGARRRRAAVLALRRLIQAAGGTYRPLSLS